MINNNFNYAWQGTTFGNGVIINGKRYATNSKGEGLFLWDDVRKEWSQLVGTCDFNVNDIKHPEDKIRRYVKGR